MRFTPVLQDLGDLPSVGFRSIQPVPLPTLPQSIPMNPLRSSYGRWPALAAAVLIAVAPSLQALLSTTGVEDFEAGTLPADWQYNHEW